MSQKVLLIGVGGSGGKLLRYTGRELERRVRAERAAAPADVEFPAGPLLPPDIQFLQIDVREHSDAIADDVPVTVSGEYTELGLAESTHNYPFYDKTIVSRPGSVDAVAGWRPDPRGDFPPPYLGAGQYRAIGRVVGLATLDKISIAIDRSIAKISDAGLEANHENNPLVIVASSLAGGSGSGIFLDVVELVMGKATGTRGWLKDNLMTVLFSADMFEALDPSMIEGVYANSLAALSELINGHEHKGSVAESEVSLVEPAGITPPNGQRSAPYNFFIGRTVGGTVIGSPNDVYRSSAKAFAAFLHNDEINADFNSYLGVNGLARPVSISPDFNIAEPSGSRRAVSSFGYANVTLGNELFRRYMAEALTKQAIRTLLEGHKNGFEDEQHMTETEMVEEKVKGARLNFFDAAKLHEIGVEHNDVLDALRGGDAKTLNSRLGEVRTKLNEVLTDSRRGNMEKKQWWELFKSEFNALTEPFKDEENARLATRARAWVTEVQEDLLSATSEAIASEGFRVTLGLIDDLGKQLSDAADELEQEADTEQDAQESKWTDTMLMFKGIVDAVIGPNHGVIGNATEPAIEAFRRELEVDLRRHAAELIRELVADVIPELRKSVSRAQEELMDEFDGRFKDVFSQLPDKEIPSHLRATRNEVLLVPQADYADRMTDLIKDTFADDGVAAGAPVRRAVIEILSGAWPNRSQAAKQLEVAPSMVLVRDGSNWYPKAGITKTTGARSAKPSYRITLGRRDERPTCRLADVLARAGEWVENRNGPIKDETSQSLRSWFTLGSTGLEAEESPQRVELFLDALQKAINLARPMVGLNQTVFDAVHPDSESTPTFTIGKIPLEQLGDGAKRAKEILTRAGVPEAAVEDKLDARSTDDEVEIGGFFTKSMHPVVLESLARPIVNDWTRRATDGGREEFWTRRRAKRLESFVPLPKSRLSAFVRGWFTAIILGELQPFTSWGPDVSIWTPAGYKSFPDHTLGGDPKSRLEAIGALLETLPLAIGEYSSAGAADFEVKTESLAAYMRVIELGLPADGGAKYREPGAVLADWITDGKLPSGQKGVEEHPTPDPINAGPVDGDSAARREAVLSSLEAARNAFTEEAKEFELSTNPEFLVPATFEMATVIDTELGLLHEVVRAHDALAVGAGGIL